VTSIGVCSHTMPGAAESAQQCGLQGHVVDGLGYGTNPDRVVWAAYCSRCGARLTPPAHTRSDAGQAGTPS